MLYKTVSAPPCNLMWVSRLEPMLTGGLIKHTGFNCNYVSLDQHEVSGDNYLHAEISTGNYFRNTDSYLMSLTLSNDCSIQLQQCCMLVQQKCSKQNNLSSGRCKISSTASHTCTMTVPHEYSLVVKCFGNSEVMKDLTYFIFSHQRRHLVWLQRNSSSTMQRMFSTTCQRLQNIHVGPVRRFTWLFHQDTTSQEQLVCCVEPLSGLGVHTLELIRIRGSHSLIYKILKGA